METETLMKKSNILFFILFVLLICFLLVAVVVIRSTIYVTPRERMQIDLADRFGVKIEDYPNRSAFPVGYFSTILKPEMTITEVHEIVQGYQRVLHCGKRSEIYYYFSSDLANAKRFKIRYDDQGNYLGIEGEEDDSRTLQTYGCDPGLILK
jgi:hypothetical protein